MYTVDVNFSSNSRPRNKTTQLGSSSDWYAKRPSLAYLREYEAAAMYDNTIKYCFSIMLDAAIAACGEIEHPDAEVQEYLRYNIEILRDLHGVDYTTTIKRLIEIPFWAGYGVSEVLYKVHGNTLFINDFADYHPSTIKIRTNRKGRLVEGEPGKDGMASGIYQTGLNAPEEQLPLWKLVYLVRDKKFNNYYGRSGVEPLYRWHVLKEAIIDMHTVSLDRHGNPIVAIILPKVASMEREVNPETGEETVISAQEALERQVQNSRFGANGNILFLSQIDPNMKPDVKVLTTGNNVGDSFLRAIDNCDRQIAKGMLVPYGLVETTEETQFERHLEIYNRVIKSIYRDFIQPIVTQSFGRLIQFSYARAAASTPPTLPINNTGRPEDRVALMTMIKGLTESAYLNPLNDTDWESIRQMTALDKRPQSEDDREFIRQLLIYPRQPRDGSPGKVNPERDRSMEGKVKGSGAANRGRPAGITTPHTRADEPKT